MTQEKPRVLVIDDRAPVNKRLAIAAAMTIAAGRALHSTQDLYRFKPPQSPPKLQKPNRKARRAQLVKSKRPKA